MEKWWEVRGLRYVGTCSVECCEGIHQSLELVSLGYAWHNKLHKCWVVESCHTEHSWQGCYPVLLCWLTVDYPHVTYFLFAILFLHIFNSSSAINSLYKCHPTYLFLPAYYLPLLCTLKVVVIDYQSPELQGPGSRNHVGLSSITIVVVKLTETISGYRKPCKIHTKTWSFW
jgi:hypothetical protein